MSASMSTSANQRPKQRQRPSAAGQVEPSTRGGDTTIRRRVNSSAATRTTRNQISPTRVTRKATNQMIPMTRSTSNESTADMFTAKSRHTYVSKGVQAQTRGAHENTHDMLSPPLTRSNSSTRTSHDIHTRSRSHVRTNPMSHTNSNSKTKAGSSQKSRALSPLENLV